MSKTLDASTRSHLCAWAERSLRAPDSGIGRMLAFLGKLDDDDFSRYLDLGWDRVARESGAYDATDSVCVNGHTITHTGDCVFDCERQQQEMNERDAELPHCELCGVAVDNFELGDAPFCGECRSVINVLHGEAIAYDASLASSQMPFEVSEEICSDCGEFLVTKSEHENGQCEGCRASMGEELKRDEAARREAFDRQHPLAVPANEVPSRTEPSASGFFPVPVAGDSAREDVAKAFAYIVADLRPVTAASVSQLTHCAISREALDAVYARLESALGKLAK